jgi:hypothetical protein
VALYPMDVLIPLTVVRARSRKHVEGAVLQMFAGVYHHQLVFTMVYRLADPRFPIFVVGLSIVRPTFALVLIHAVEAAIPLDVEMLCFSCLMA